MGDLGGVVQPFNPSAPSATAPASAPARTTEIVFESSGDAFTCVIAPCKALDTHLAAALRKPQLTINSNWGNRPDVNVLHVLHVAHGGGPAIRVLPVGAQASSEFKRFHSECMREHQALVIRINEAQELFLGPVDSLQEDGSVLPVYWGWLLAAGIPSLVCAMLDRSQMGLIFDLDETLLVAHSANTVEGRMESCRKARSQMLEQLASGTLSAQERERLQLSSNSLQKEVDLLAHDAGLIRRFAQTNSVLVDGKVYGSRLETAYLEDGSTIQRPVIRLQDGLIILTRIDPLNSKTSMLLRVRPGWNELRAFLAGELDRKQRFDVYVCTAAERQYALEVWRLLDINGAIIPKEQRQQRIVNVSGGRKKTLLHSLGVLSSRAANKAISLQGEESTASKQLPLAVVVDDRTEVWEDASQPHILQVLPWMFYRDEAARITKANTQVAAASERELARVRTAILQLRGEVYQCIDQRVRPVMDRFANRGAPQAAQETDMANLLPPLLSVPALLMDPAWTSTYGMPRPSIAAMAVFPEDPQGEFGPPPPAALPPPASALPAPQPPALPAVSLKPKDPRTAAQQQQQLQLQQQLQRPHPPGAAPEGPASAAELPAPRPEDPRRKRSADPQMAPGATASAAAGTAAAAAGATGAAAAPMTPAPPMHLGGPGGAPTEGQSRGPSEEASTRAGQAGPTTAAGGAKSSSTEQILATLLRLTLGSSALGGGVDQDLPAAPAQLTQLAQANPPLFQVMHMIVQVMLANPTLQHAAVSVMEACVKRPDSVPGVVEFLKRNPEKGLVSLYDALQVEKLRHEGSLAAHGAPAPAPPQAPPAAPTPTPPPHLAQQHQQQQPQAPSVALAPPPSTVPAHLGPPPPPPPPPAARPASTPSPSLPAGLVGAPAAAPAVPPAPAAPAAEDPGMAPPSRGSSGPGEHMDVDGRGGPVVQSLMPGSVAPQLGAYSAAGAKADNVDQGAVAAAAAAEGGQAASAMDVEESEGVGARPAVLHPPPPLPLEQQQQQQTLKRKQSPALSEARPEPPTAAAPGGGDGGEEGADEEPRRKQPRAGTSTSPGAAAAAAAANAPAAAVPSAGGGGGAAAVAAPSRGAPPPAAPSAVPSAGPAHAPQDPQQQQQQQQRVVEVAPPHAPALSQPVLPHAIPPQPLPAAAPIDQALSQAAPGHPPPPPHPAAAGGHPSPPTQSPAKTAPPAPSPPQQPAPDITATSQPYAPSPPTTTPAATAAPPPAGIPDRGAQEGPAGAQLGLIDASSAPSEGKRRREELPEPPAAAPLPQPPTRRPTPPTQPTPAHPTPPPPGQAAAGAPAAGGGGERPAMDAATSLNQPAAAHMSAMSALAAQQQQMQMMGGGMLPPGGIPDMARMKHELAMLESMIAIMQANGGDPNAPLAPGMLPFPLPVPLSGPLPLGLPGALNPGMPQLPPGLSGLPVGLPQLLAASAGLPAGSAGLPAGAGGLAADVPSSSAAAAAAAEAASSAGMPAGLPVTLPAGSRVLPALASQPLPTIGPGGIPLPEPPKPMAQSLFGMSAEQPSLLAGMPRPQPPQLLPQPPQQSINAVLHPPPPTAPTSQAEQQQQQKQQPQQQQQQASEAEEFARILPKARAKLQKVAKNRQAVFKFNSAQVFSPSAGSHRGLGWSVQVIWNGRNIGSGLAVNKQDAKQVASARALQALRAESNSGKSLAPKEERAQAPSQTPLPSKPQSSESLLLPSPAVPPAPPVQPPAPPAQPHMGGVLHPPGGSAADAAPEQQQQQGQQQGLGVGASKMQPSQQQQQQQQQPAEGGVQGQEVANGPNALAVLSRLLPGVRRQINVKPTRTVEGCKLSPVEIVMDCRQLRQHGSRVYRAECVGFAKSHAKQCAALKILEDLGVPVTYSSPPVDLKSPVQPQFQAWRARPLWLNNGSAQEGGVATVVSHEQKQTEGSPGRAEPQSAKSRHAQHQHQQQQRRHRSDLERALAEDGAVLSGGGSSGGEEEHHAQQQPQGQRDGSSSRGESKEQQQPPHAVPAQGPAGWGPEVGMGEAPWRKQKPVGMGGGPMGNMEGPSPASGGGGPWAGPGGVLPPAGLPSQGPLSGPCGMMLGAPANQGLQSLQQQQQQQQMEMQMGGGNSMAMLSQQQMGGPGMGMSMSMPQQQSLLQGPQGLRPPGLPLQGPGGLMQEPGGPQAGMLQGMGPGSMPMGSGSGGLGGGGMPGGMGMGGMGGMGGPPNAMARGGPGGMGLGGMGSMMGGGGGGAGGMGGGPQGMMGPQGGGGVSGGGMMQGGGGMGMGGMGMGSMGMAAGPGGMGGGPTMPHPTMVLPPDVALANGNAAAAAAAAGGAGGAGGGMGGNNANVMPAHMPQQLNAMLNSAQLSPAQYTEIGRALMTLGMAGPGQPLAHDMRVAAAIPDLVHALKWGGGPEVMFNLARNVRANIGSTPLPQQPSLPQPPRPSPPMMAAPGGMPTGAFGGPLFPPAPLLDPQQQQRMQQQQQQQQQPMPLPPQAQGAFPPQGRSAMAGGMGSMPPQSLSLQGLPLQQQQQQQQQQGMMLMAGTTPSTPPWHKQRQQQQQQQMGGLLQGPQPPGLLPHTAQPPVQAGQPFMPAPPQQMGGPMQPLPPWVLQQQQQQQQEREQQQQQHEREQQQQQQNGAVVIAGAEPEGGFGDGHGSGSSSARRDGEAEERVGQRAGTERPRPGIGAAAPMEGGMVFNMKRQGAAARLQAVRPGPRAARLQQGRESDSTEPSEPNQALPSMPTGRNAPKSLIPDLKVQQARQQQTTTRQAQWDKELAKEQRGSKEGPSRGQASQQQQQQQQRLQSQGQRQRERARREQQQQQQQQHARREKKVLDLDALYVAGRSGAGRGVHSSTWADAMDDLGDVLDGEESGPPPASAASGKPKAPTTASAGQAGAAAGKGAAEAGAAAGAGGAGKAAQQAAESSEEEEGELPSEEGEYVEPS